MKISSVFFMLFLVIVIFPATIFFIVKQPPVGNLTNIGNQTNQLENDPLVQRIKSEVILPFCETGGQITDSDIPNHFSQSFIDFYVSQEGEVDVSTLELITPLFAATRSHRFMFTDLQEFTDCNSHIENIKSKEIEPYEPRLAEDIGYADIQYEYKPADNITIVLFLKEIDNTLKIRSVNRSASVQLQNP
jgi:hypothetical protein